MIARLLTRTAAMLREAIGRAAPLRLARDRRGNVMMIFAFAVVPIAFATGMGIDYGAAMRIQTRLNSVADAAALAPVSKPMMSKTMLTACGIARNTFTSQMGSIYGLTLDPNVASNLTITMTDTLPIGPPVTITCPLLNVTIPVPSVLPLQRTVTVTYRGTSKNTFSSILGISTLTVKGTSTTKTTLAPYIDIHVALDTSQSMGLAANDASAQLMWTYTSYANGASHGCTFGCHVFQAAESGAPNASFRLANDQIAKLIGAKLRVDVLREAMQDMITTADTSEGTQSLYRFAMYRIGATTTPILPLTDNKTTALNTVNTLTLGPNNSGGTGDTNLPHFPGYIAPQITVHGDGTTQAQARAFLFIVTDGVTDTAGGSCTYGHCTKPIDPATCQQFKDNNVTVGVVYTTYLPVKAQPLNPSSTALRDEYVNLVKRFSWPGYSSPNPADNSADIGPALQACASPGWYFEASDETTIHAAMTKLFAQAAQSSVISR